MSSSYNPPRPPVGYGDDGQRSDEPGPKGGGKSRMVLAVGALAVVGVLILAVAMFAGGKDDTNDGGGSAAGASAAYSLAAPAEGRTAATLEIISGAETMTIRGADTGSDLYQISTPSDGSLVPTATLEGDTVRVSMNSSGRTGAATAEIVLSSAVTWQLTLGGGGMTETVDFSEGQLSGIEFTSGAGEIDLTLPTATGTLGVILTGGAGTVNVHLPADLPVQVIVSGAGAGILTIDGETTNGAPAGTELTPDDWSQASDKYMIEAQSGLATLVVDRIG